LSHEGQFKFFGFFWLIQSRLGVLVL
jgi:hypothetical protein